MRALIIKPNFGSSFSALTHSLLKFLLPLALFTLVSVDLTILAFILVFVFKWRVLAVKFRYWAINIQSNLVDLIVSLSVVEFMSQVPWQGRLGWLLFYIVWVAAIKRLTTQKGSIVQALISQAIGTAALLYSFSSFELGPMMIGVWFISYFSAQHILNIAEERHAGSIAHVWGLFSVQLTWVLGHWQLWYWVVPQIVLIQLVTFLPLSYLYVMHKSKTLTPFVLRVTMISMVIAVLAILLLADWQDKVI